MYHTVHELLTQSNKLIEELGDEKAGAEVECKEWLT